MDVWRWGRPKRRRFHSPDDEAAYRQAKWRERRRLLGLVVAGVLGFLAFVFLVFQILDQVSAPPQRKGGGR